MKQYFVHYYRDFGNTYNLFYTENAEETKAAIESGYERITRKQAIELCRAEIRRRKDNPAASGYADSAIYPFSAGQDEDFENYPWTKNGYIVERRI